MDDDVKLPLVYWFARLLFVPGLVVIVHLCSLFVACVFFFSAVIIVGVDVVAVVSGLDDDLAV